MKNIFNFIEIFNLELLLLLSMFFFAITNFINILNVYITQQINLNKYTTLLNTYYKVKLAEQKSNTIF